MIGLEIGSDPKSGAIRIACRATLSHADVAALQRELVGRSGGQTTFIVAMRERADGGREMLLIPASFSSPAERGPRLFDIADTSNVASFARALAPRAAPSVMSAMAPPATGRPSTSR